MKNLNKIQKIKLKKYYYHYHYSQTAFHSGNQTRVEDEEREEIISCTI